MATGIIPNIGRPGIGSSITVQKLNVARAGSEEFYPAGGTIEGSKTRDPGNSASSILSLRAGLLMGRITGGFWANSILGATTGAYTSGGLSLSASAATVTELVRRVGASGTFKLVGPATAGGSNNTTTVTYSAASGTTITISDIGADRISGCLICPSDGSETILSYIPTGYNLLLPGAAADTDNADINFPRIPIAAVIDSANLIDWPSDTTLQAYVRTSLSTASGGKFVFSDIYSS